MVSGWIRDEQGTGKWPTPKRELRWEAPRREKDRNFPAGNRAVARWPMRTPVFSTLPMAPDLHCLRVFEPLGALPEAEDSGHSGLFRLSALNCGRAEANHELELLGIPAPANWLPYTSSPPAFLRSRQARPRSCSASGRWPQWRWRATTRMRGVGRAPRLSGPSASLRGRNRFVADLRRGPGIMEAANGDATKLAERPSDSISGCPSASPESLHYPRPQLRIPLIFHAQAGLLTSPKHWWFFPEVLAPGRNV